MALPGIVYIRSDGDNGIEMTSKTDPEATAYIRADNVHRTTVTPEMDVFQEHEDDEFDDTLKKPCCRCQHQQGDVEEYPCSMCIHSI